MDKKKLNAKDFINIGIFTVIYFVMFFITGMLGYIPIFAVMCGWQYLSTQSILIPATG